MSKNTILLLAIFILPLVAYFYVSNTNESNATIATTTKPQIIKFSSTMCGECKRMDKTIETVYPKYKNDIQLIPIGVQNNTKYTNDMIGKYRVTLVPTTILIKKDQKIFKRIEGYVDTVTFEKYLKELNND